MADENSLVRIGQYKNYTYGYMYENRDNPDIIKYNAILRDIVYKSKPVREYLNWLDGLASPTP